MTSRVMLFIDADNVSADVISQAIAKVMADHGAIHVRRAHCTAEAALKHAKLFKSLSIRPIVNLASGKNSTDIALAVDAMELVCAERPELVVIVSSDSDFAPLVIRLREKGCRVCGIGQRGKTGDEVVDVYDDFIDFEHRKPPPPAPRQPQPPRSRGGRGDRPPAARGPERPAERPDGRAAGRGPRRPPEREAEWFDDRPSDSEIDRAMGWPPSERSERPPQQQPRGRGRRGGRRDERVAESATDLPVELPVEPPFDSPAGRFFEPPVELPPEPFHEPSAEPAVVSVTDPVVDAEPSPEPAEPAAAPARKRASARRPRSGKAARETAAPEPEAAPVVEELPAVPEPAPPIAERLALASPPPPTPLSAEALAALAGSDLPIEVQRLLEAIPELLGGGVFELSHAAERLRAIGLLAKNAPSTKLFRKYPDLFVLTPGRQPNKVRFSGPVPA